MSVENTWRDKAEFALLIAPVVISGLVSIADLLGLLDSIPWLAQRVPTITLLLVGFVAGYLVLERRSVLSATYADLQRRIDKINQQLDDNLHVTISSLKGVESRSFASGTDLLRYVNKRLSQARVRVDDLSWSPAVGLGQGLQVTQDVNHLYEKRLTQVARRIPYREVFIFNKPERVGKLRRRLGQNLEGYSCAYYEHWTVPLLQFMLIDDEEVIFLSDQYPVYVAVRQPDIVNLFVKYYETIWQQAIPLKIGTQTYNENLEKILQE